MKLNVEIKSTYFDFKYLFVGLSKLVSYDPVEGGDVIAQEKRKLDQGVKLPQDKIVELVKKNRREFYKY